MKKNNKGFTLVELIVVLVILAILAAILVPALLGYIDRAREKQYVLNAKSWLTAAQAEMSSLYGEGLDAETISTAARKSVVSATADCDKCTDFKIYTDSYTAGATSDNHVSYTNTGASYTENGVTIAFTGTSWEKDGTHGGSTEYDLK